MQIPLPQPQSAGANDISYTNNDGQTPIKMSTYPDNTQYNINSLGVMHVWSRLGQNVLFC